MTCTWGDGSPHSVGTGRREYPGRCCQTWSEGGSSLVCQGRLKSGSREGGERGDKWSADRDGSEWGTENERGMGRG